MQKIKFRAWNIVGKCMLTNDDLWDIPFNELFIHTPDQRPFNIMQYSGLKDKKGKEIFEGDILDHFATFGYVIFEDGMFTHNLSEKVNFGHRQPLCYLDTTQCEVIGNIYENPDLLAVNEG